MNNFFSVIIPTFKRKLKLQRAILSVIKQTYKEWEIIIVDNNSNDGTKELVKSFNDNRIRLFNINNNGVIAASRNLGIKKSKGNYLSFLDSDDWWHKDKLSLTNNHASEGKKFLYHDMYLNSKHKILTRKTGYCRVLSDNPFLDLKINGPAFATSSVSIEKKLFLENSLFNESKNYIAWEDYDAWLRISRVYKDLFLIKKTLGYINIENDNYLDSEKTIKNIIEFKKNYIDDEKLPSWCLYSIIKSNFKLKKFEEVNYFMKKIKLRELKFKQILLLLSYKFKLFFN